MRAGDREAAAEFLFTYERLIRRRLRSRLGRAARRIYDTDDLFLTIARRLDELVLAHRLRAGSVEEVWALMGRIARRCAVDQATIIARETRAAEAVALRRAPVAAAERERTRLLLERARERLEPADMRVVVLRVADRTFAQIARWLGIAAPAARKSWQRSKKR